MSWAMGLVDLLSNLQSRPVAGPMPWPNSQTFEEDLMVHVFARFPFFPSEFLSVYNGSV